MSAKLLEGKPIAERIRKETRERAGALRKKGIVPQLAMVRVAGSAASDVYRGRLARACEELSILFSERIVPAGAREADILGLLDALSKDAAVHGILLEMPLPTGVDLARVRVKIDPAKDVERISPQSQGMLVYGAPHYAPCTAMAAMEVLLSSGIDPKGKEAVVVGSSEIVGKPLGLLLLDRLATVTTCHIATKDLAFHTRRAEILVSAAGKAGLIKRDMVKPGAVVVDVGVNHIPDGKGGTRLAGDVDFEAVRDVAGFLTPVPGGVGPVTTAIALRNTVLAAEAAPA